jgi:hypothetical protein
MSIFVAPCCVIEKKSVISGTMFSCCLVVLRAYERIIDFNTRRKAEDRLPALMLTGTPPVRNLN